MINKNLEIIQQKGIGKYLRGKGEYSFYVQLGLTNDGEYFVNSFLNPNLAHFNKCLYKGEDKNKAKEIFNEVIERDREMKKNWIDNKFNKKIFYN